MINKFELLLEKVYEKMSILLEDNLSYYGSNTKDLLKFLNNTDNKFRNIKPDHEDELGSYISSQLDKMGYDFIGAGYSRNVFAIDEDLIIKINVSNSRQNKNESNIKLQTIMSPYVPKIFYKSKLSFVPWIISERCNPLPNLEVETAIEWLSDAGVSQEEIDDLLDFRQEKLEGGEEIDIINAWVLSVIDNSEEFEPNSELEQKILEAYSTSLFEVEDVGMSNVGYGSDGRIVILDTGLERIS
jgi:hypothetical protein